MVQLSKTFLYIALAMMISLCGHAFAQSDSPTIVGGYSVADIASPEVISAVKFAITAKNALPHKRPTKLVSIKTAQSQVVAGTNYKACLVVRQKAKTFTISTTVYRDLSGVMRLTEWTKARC